MACSDDPSVRDDDDGCVCPFCGADIPDENIDADEWSGVAEAVCPKCGKGYSFLAENLPRKPEPAVPAPVPEPAADNTPDTMEALPVPGKWFGADKAVPPPGVPVLVAYRDHGGNIHRYGERAAIWDESRSQWQWAEYAVFGQGYIVPPMKVLAWTGRPEAPQEMLKG